MTDSQTLYAPRMRVCFDSFDGGCPAGRIYFSSLARPVSFTDADSLLLRAEACFDWLSEDFPASFQRKRSFFGEGAPLCRVPLEDADLKPRSDHSTQRGALETLVVQIDSRRDCSWQGRMQWQSGESDAPILLFESALGFLRLVEAQLRCFAEAAQ